MELRYNRIIVYKIEMAYIEAKRSLVNVYTSFCTFSESSSPPSVVNPMLLKDKRKVLVGVYILISTLHIFLYVYTYTNILVYVQEIPFALSLNRPLLLLWLMTCSSLSGFYCLPNVLRGENGREKRRDKFFRLKSRHIHER